MNNIFRIIKDVFCAVFIICFFVGCATVIIYIGNFISKLFFTGEMSVFLSTLIIGFFILLVICATIDEFSNR